MQLYLEKEFIDEFIDLDLKNEFIDDFYYELINRSKGYQLYTNFTEQEFYEQKEHLVIRCISEGSVSVSFNKSKENFFNNEETIHKLLLVSNAHDNRQEYNNFECISSKNLIDKWKRYTTKRRFLEVPTTIDDSIPSNEKFSKWEDLKYFCQHPLNEIIIYDKYLLVDNDYNSINFNLLPMLQQFKKMSSQRLKIKIITLPEMIKPNSDRDLKSKAREIKDIIRKKIKYIDIEILTLNNENQHLQHDRWIYTNLFFISRGSGFNIFGPHGLMKRESSEIKFRFIFLRKFNSLFRVRRKEIDKIIQSSEVIK
tara:strand:- start:164 stop:1096 length:933 start_codon:yes stop_codon:yes gene_type:complete